MTVRHRYLLSARRALTALGLLCFASFGHATTLHVSAAASLSDALDEAIARYTQAHAEIVIVPLYASSSTLARQIASGAPSDLFISANVAWMDWLEEQGVTLAQRADLLRNRLALVAPAASDASHFTPGEDGSLADLLPAGERLSVGDPDHVPAGLYARQALENLGEWQILEPRLARASDVRAALALVERGEAPLGVVYRTDAEASATVRILGLFPEESHEPVVYPIALTPSGRSRDAAGHDEAAAFRAWLESAEAREIFSAHGFSAGGH